MLDGLLNRSNFKTKCKSAITRTKTRLEIIKKKRNSVQKFLKKDIADLLKNNLDRNAYGRAEGLYTELNLTSCYDYVGQCCACILENLKEMHKQRECPEKCKVAVSSLVYAAARFSDLPELRDLRNQLNTKYDYSLESFVSEEFVEKLKSDPPTIEMKIQLMQEIAQEFSVKWDSLLLQQQLFTQGTDNRNKTVLGPRVSTGDRMFKSMSTAAQVNKMKQDDKSNTTKLMNEEENDKLKTRRHNSYSQFNENVSQITFQELNNLKLAKIHTSTARNEEIAGKNKQEDENLSSRNEVEQNSSMDGDGDDDDLFSEAKPRPKSVRTKKQNLTGSSATRRSTVTVDEEEEEDEEMVKLPLKSSVKAVGLISVQKDDNATATATVNATSVLPPPPGRRRYLFVESPKKESQSGSPVGSVRSQFLRPEYRQPDSPTDS